MAQDQSSGVHAAEGAALGFWYQSFYALLTLVTRGGSVCLNSFWGVLKWLSRPFQAAAGIGVAKLMYAWSGVFPPSDECGLLPL